MFTHVGWVRIVGGNTKKINNKHHDHVVLTAVETIAPHERSESERESWLLPPL